WIDARKNFLKHLRQGELTMAETIRYLEVAEADTLAADLPTLTAWSAASSPDKELALNQASLDVDGAMPYQGRRYDAQQSRQFPRVAEDDGAAGTTDLVVSPESLIWDWDSAGN